jgi:hypothetical protein
LGRKELQRLGRRLTRLHGPPRRSVARKGGQAPAENGKLRGGKTTGS